MQGKCETCRWWGREREHDHDRPWGTCRVKPPRLWADEVLDCPDGTPLHVARAEWPWTAFDDWCGEYQKKEHTDA